MLRPIFAAVVWLVLQTACFSQDIFAVSGTERGKAYLMVIGEDGTVSVNPLRVVNVGADPVPFPPGPDDPQPPPPTLSPFAQEVSRQTTAVLNSGGSLTTGAGLFEVYSAVWEAVADGSIAPGSALPAVKAATDIVLMNQPDKDKWGGWRESVGEALNTLVQQGQLSTKEQYVAALKDVAAGLKHATGYSPNIKIGDGSQPFIGGFDIGKILDLIKVIMAILDLFKTFKAEEATIAVEAMLQRAAEAQAAGLPVPQK